MVVDETLRVADYLESGHNHGSAADNQTELVTAASCSSMTRVDSAEGGAHLADVVLDRRSGMSKGVQRKVGVVLRYDAPSPKLPKSQKNIN
eukprot:3351931-Amphidinium_carterae.1